MRICIDPGHGGLDPGCVSDSGLTEKETNLRVALMLERFLTDQGVQVLMTRREDSDLGLSKRCQMANRWRADIFVSLHADAGSPEVKGYHVICSIHSKPDEGGGKLARLIVDELYVLTGRPPLKRGDNGVWSRESEKNPGTDYYAVIRETNMPAVIIERGFLTNPEEEQLLYDENYLQLQAKGIARAILRYFGLEMREVNYMFADTQFHWARDDIEYAGQIGIVRGDEKGNFNPDHSATRAEVVVLIVRATRYILGEVRKMLNR